MKQYHIFFSFNCTLILVDRVTWKDMTKDLIILAYSGGLDTSCILKW